MDIARLTSSGITAPGYPVPSRSRERMLELVSEVDAGQPVHDLVERVVQGEVLQRPRTIYSSTQDYLDSRLFEGAYGVDDGSADLRKHSAFSQSSYAVGAYLSHTREFIQPDVSRGKQVDYFI